MEQHILLSDFYQISLAHIKGVLQRSAWDPTAHSHDHFELFVHIKGHIQIFVEENRYSLSGGEIRFYSAGELHGGDLGGDEEIEWYQINIPAAFLSAPNGKALTRIFWDRKFGTGNVIRSQKQEEIVSMLENAFALYKNNDPLAMCYAQTVVVGLLCLIYADENRLSSAAEKRTPALEKIFDMIYHDFANLSSVYDIAERTHFSVSYINKLFHTHVGVSPYQFLLGKKLDEAKKALKNGKSVTEAARLAGFRDYSGFITLFRKRFGVTPHKYKK